MRCLTVPERQLVGIRHENAHRRFWVEVMYDGDHGMSLTPSNPMQKLVDYTTNRYRCSYNCVLGHVHQVYLTSWYIFSMRGFFP